MRPKLWRKRLVLSVQPKGRSTFRKRLNNDDTQQYIKIVQFLYHWSMEITRKWYGSFRDVAKIITATEN